MSAIRSPESAAPPSILPQESTLLVVDDTPQNLALLGELLKPLYRVRVAVSGDRALRAVQIVPIPDLILLDVMMPGMDGYEVLRRLRQNPLTRAIPVVFITALNNPKDEERGLELGAVDYITKPFNPAVVLARVHTHLELKHARDQLTSKNDWLETEVARRMRENLLVQDLSVRTLACLAEARDNETGHHIVRTQHYVKVLAEYLQRSPGYQSALANGRLERVVKAAPLHDIGKVGIPDSILLKPGRLTAEEFQIMKTHPSIGAQAIDRALKQSAGGDAQQASLISGAFSFMHVAREISLYHHEKWDGSGYPEGLAGEAIPVAARLMALADVFDALISRRVYKPPMSLKQASQIIREGTGKHFDPVVVDAFFCCQAEFAAIAARYPDPLLE